MSCEIYVEGGGDPSSLRSECRQGFRELLERSGFSGRMPKVISCGSRQDAYRQFKMAHESRSADFVALLIDSEDPVEDIEKPWQHLASRKGDAMPRPPGAEEYQALLMTTCMETWLVADREGLRRVYKGGCLQESALPSLVELERRHRHDVQDALGHASRACSNAYKKGRRSFLLLAEVQPETLRTALPSFARTLRILGEKL